MKQEDMKTERMKRKILSYEMAKKMGMPTSTYSHMENGNTIARDYHLDRFERVIREHDAELALSQMLPSPQVKEDIPDMVNSPPHYTQGGIEVIDYMKAKMTPEQFDGYLIGNIIKYTSRFQGKNGLEDLQKAKWYIDKYIETRGDEA